MLTLTYEYKIEPTKRQIVAIEYYLNVCRKVWNYALPERQDWLNSRKSNVNACSLVSEYIIPPNQSYPNSVKQATRKDFHFKLSHHLVQAAGMVFVEDLNFKAWAKRMLGKHSLDAGFGQFINILQWVCWKEQRQVSRNQEI